MIVLRRFYTGTLTTLPDQALVKRGPYRLVRNPGYTGSLLTWTGGAATSRNLPVLILALAILGWAYARRIRAEEAMLVDSLGTPYTDYQKKSWRLVPFLF